MNAEVLVRNADRLFINGNWVLPASASTIDVINPATERVFFSVAEAGATDMSRAIDAARVAFDAGPWPRLSHQERARYLRAFADGVEARVDELAEIWPRQSGITYAAARASVAGVPRIFRYYADLAGTFDFEEPSKPTAGGSFARLVREPVGVVGAIIPWNGPLDLTSWKIAPALLAGCTMIVKASPEAPGELYLLAEVAEAVGLPPGVINVLTADRAVSEMLVTDHRVDKIAFTGSTAAGRRIASLCGERIARYTLELGGKSAALILDDIDVETAAASLAADESYLTGQVCSSLTRIIVSDHRHDAMAEALASVFSAVRVGDPFDPATQMGPLAMRRQRDRVESLISAGLHEGATLVTGGGRPKHLDHGFFIEPTVFADVDNGSTVAREEIFGPVLSVIRARNEEEAIRIANDSIYGLNASVFTDDVDHAYEVARQLRTGTVGHNAWRTDFGVAFGGFKQSGIGREGGREGLRAYLETKVVILNGTPSAFSPSSLKS